MPTPPAGTRSQQATMMSALGVTKNRRFDMAQPAGDAVYGGHRDRTGVLGSIKICATGDDLVSADISIKSDGVWAFTSTRLRVRQGA